MSLDHRIVMPPAEEFQGLSPEELPKGLEGLVVVELGDYVAMPACTRALGEMGAAVYKIETIKGNLHRGDGVGFGMPELGPGNPAFDMSNANKKFLSIDMKSDGGRELVEKLLEQADVFVTSLRNPSLKRLGYDYETLHARYPRLVYGQMRGYGERGAMKDAKGFDATCYSARGGLLMSIPQAGEHFQPGNMPAAFGDFNSCIALGLGIMSAVWRAQRTGVGDHVTVNLHHMALWGMQVPVVSAPFGVPFPKSRKAVPCPTNNSYMTADGVWFLICYGTYDSWYPFVALLIVLEDGKVNAFFDKQIGVVFQAVATIVVDFNNGALCDEVFLSVLRNAQTAARRSACLGLVSVGLQGRSAVDVQGVANGDAIQTVARAGNRGALNEQLASRKAVRSVVLEGDFRTVCDVEVRTVGAVAPVVDHGQLACVHLNEERACNARTIMVEHNLGTADHIKVVTAVATVPLQRILRVVGNNQGRPVGNVQLVVRGEVDRMSARSSTRSV